MRAIKKVDSDKIKGNKAIGVVIACFKGTE